MNGLFDPFFDPVLAPVIAHMSFGYAVLMLWLGTLCMGRIFAISACMVTAMLTLLAGYIEPSLPRYLLWIVGTLAVVTFSGSLYLRLRRLAP